MAGAPDESAPSPIRPERPRPRRRTRSRRRIAAIVLGVALLLLILDQLGVRRLSGADFPPHDPLGLALRTHVERLAAPTWAGRKPGTPGNAEAARYLAAELAAAGATPLPSLAAAAGDPLEAYLSPLPATRARPSLGHNVIGYLPADQPAPGASSDVIVLGAHFDHLGETSNGAFLGADDNASGVAVLLGALGALRGVPRQHAVFIIFFNTEESPYFSTGLQGSRAFLAALPPEIPSLSSIRLAVILDLIGGVVWRHTADTIFACGAEKAAGLPTIVDDVDEPGVSVRRLGIHMVENIPGYRPQPVSDYDVFRERGIPFLFLSSGRTPRYHKITDLPDTLHYDRMAATSRWIAALVTRLDALQEPFRFDAAGADLAKDAETMEWALSAAASPLRWVPGTGPITAFRLLGDRSRVAALRQGGRALTGEDAPSLERAGARLQCLLYSFPVCFTL